MSDSEATTGTPAEGELPRLASMWARLERRLDNGAYAWRQICPAPDGQWTDGPLHDQDGQDPAWSSSPRDVSLPRNVVLTRLGDGSWRFPAG